MKTKRFIVSALFISFPSFGVFGQNDACLGYDNVYSKTPISRRGPVLEDFKHKEAYTLMLSSIETEPAFFPLLTNLHLLTIHKATIPRFETDFSIFKCLKEVSLYKIGLQEIPKNLDKCVNLELIDLKGNCISSIYGDFFQSPYFKKVEISRQCVEKVKIEGKGVAKSLMVLDLSENGLDFEKGFFGFPMLEELYLQKCSLVNTPDVSALKNLKKLNLSGNGLTSLGFSLKGATELYSLDVSDNLELNSLPDYIFSLPKLQYINIKNTGIVDKNDLEAKIAFEKKFKSSDSNISIRIDW